MYKLQSILFPKKIYNFSKAINFLIKYNYNPKKFHETENYYRFRFYNPSYLKSKGYNRIRTKKISKGILLVLFYYQKKNKK